MLPKDTLEAFKLEAIRPQHLKQYIQHLTKKQLSVIISNFAKKNLVVSFRNNEILFRFVRLRSTG